MALGAGVGVLDGKRKARKKSIRATTASRQAESRKYGHADAVSVRSWRGAGDPRKHQSWGACNDGAVDKGVVRLRDGEAVWSQSISWRSFYH